MTCLLVVDDEPFHLMLIEEFLAGAYQLVTAGDGFEALQLLEQEPDHFDAVILDRYMPRLDGMETLRRIRTDTRFRLMPVIMQTSACLPGEVAEGLAAGAWYYLAKPYDGAALCSIVHSALNDRSNHLLVARLDTDINSLLAMTCHARYQFRTPDEAHRLAAMLARHCPNNGGLAMGLAELLLNAIEHGNLGISYAEKSQLLAADRWEEEIAQRLATADLGSRRAELEFRHTETHLRFTIRDEGAGFDWTNYLEMDPARAFHTHGRGIAIARSLAFASLEYQGTGNVVSATLRLQKEGSP